MNRGSFRVLFRRVPLFNPTKTLVTSFDVVGDIGIATNVSESGNSDRFQFGYEYYIRKGIVINWKIDASRRWKYKSWNRFVLRKTQIIFRLNNISKNNKREEVYKFDLQGVSYAIESRLLNVRRCWPRMLRIARRNFQVYDGA